MVRLTQFFVAFLIAGMACGIANAQDITIPIVPTKGYDVNYYKTTLWLYPTLDSLTGTVEMTATSMGDLTEILQHAKFLTIDSVFVDGIRSSINVTDTLSGTYMVSGFPPNYHNGSTFTLKTFYHGKGTSEAGGGNWGGVHYTGGMMFAMGVGFTAPYVSCTRHWMPCYDEPDDKADSVTLRFFADTSGIVVSNGLQTGFSLTNDGYTFTQWTVSHPIATYLLTFAFGPFQLLSIANPLNIPFDVYAFAKDTAKVRLLMDKSAEKGLVFFDSLFAPYPFEKVGYVIAPIGSMEHQTMITLVNQAFDTNNTTAVHELSHQWWGDKVTCYDFNDPWLNEGFATFCESLFQERFQGKTQYWSRQHSHIASSLSATIPLYGAPFYTKPRNNYPPLIYDKGAAVLGMLRYFLGDSIFFNAIRTYGKIHAYSVVTSADLQDAFEMTAHEFFPWFFNKWVYGIGNPVFNIIWSRNASTFTVNIIQSQDSVKIGYFRLPLVIEARASGGKSERHEIWLDSVRVNQATVQNSFMPDTLVIDPDGAIIKKIVGPVKLGVLPSHTGDGGNMYPVQLQFNPNPSHQQRIAFSYQAQSINTSAAQNARLQIFDTNGKSISSVRAGAFKINTMTSSVESSFETESLASGTYLAILMFNDTIVGEGQFIITK